MSKASATEFKYNPGINVIIYFAARSAAAWSIPAFCNKLEVKGKAKVRGIRKSVTMRIAR